MRYLGPLARSRLLIVGSGYVAQHLAATCLKYTGLGITVVGFVDDDDLRTDLSQEHALPIFQLPVFKRADLERVLEQHNVDHVVFAFSRQPDSEAVDLVHLCRNHPNVQVSLVSRLFDAIPARTRLLDVYGIPLIQFETSGQRLALACKRIFDVVAAGLGLIVTLPVLLPAALAIRLESPGPILFRQTRVGRHGTPFVMYKLRSMRQPRPGEDVNASSRHTRMGCILRTSSIDELPQLWNVLRGDMSLVGPRPEQEPYVKLFSAHIPRYQQRHRMRGGLTGLAQVSRLRGDTSIVERTRLDNFYIDNWSLWRDVRILLLTFAALRPSSQGIGGEAMFRDVVAEIATQVAQQAERAETVTQRDDTDHGASVPVRTSERHGVTAG